MAAIDYKERMGQISTALVRAQVSAEEGAVEGFKLTQAIRIYTTAISRTPKLLLCTVPSLQRCLMDAGSLGLYIGSTLGQCYAVPFKNKNLKPPFDHEAVFMLGYQGMCELTRRTGEVDTIIAELVHENDEFEYRGLTTAPHHIPYGLDRKDWKHVLDGKANPGNCVLGYLMTTFRGGAIRVQALRLDQIEARRARSRARSDGPWVTDWPAMAKKTLVRYDWPYLPKTPAILVAMGMDNAIEQPTVIAGELKGPVGSGFVDEPDAQPEPETATDKLVDELIEQGKGEAAPTQPAQEAQAADKAPRKRTRKKAAPKATQEPPPAEKPPEALQEAQAEPTKPPPEHLFPEDTSVPPPKTAADVQVDTQSARDAVHKSLGKMERGHQNVLAHQFKKKHGVDWVTCDDVDMLSAFYTEIEECRVGLADM